MIASFLIVEKCQPEPKPIYEKADSLDTKADEVWHEWIEHEQKAEAERRYLDSLLYLK